MIEPSARQPRESVQAFAAFAKYRDLGPKRSLAAVGQELGKSGSLLSRWSIAHRWVERAAYYDGVQDGQRVAAAGRAVEAEAEQLVIERQAARSAWLIQGRALAAKVDQMISWPLVQRTVSEDGHTTVIEPARWRLADVAPLATAAAKLISLALDEPTDRVALEVSLTAEAERLARERGLPLESVLRLVPDAMKERGR